VCLAGTAFYLLTAGLCWAQSIALIVEIVGVETRDASTLYGVLNAIATIPFLYMIRLDGLGFSRFRKYTGRSGQTPGLTCSCSELLL